MTTKMIPDLLTAIRDMGRPERMAMAAFLVFIVAYVLASLYVGFDMQPRGAVIGRWLRRGWSRIFLQVRSDLQDAFERDEPSTKVIWIADRKRAVRR